MDTIEKPAGIGHNFPPEPVLTLAETLAIETVALKARSDELLAVASEIKVTDDDTAGRATALIGMISACVKDVDAAREARKKPFLEGGRTVDAHFGAICLALNGPDAKKRGGKALQIAAAVDDHRRKVEAAAAAERKRLEDEAAAQRRKAEKAAEDLRLAEEAQRRAAAEAAERVRKAEEEARQAGDREAMEKAARARAEAEAQRLRDEKAATQRRLDAEIAANAATLKAETLERQADRTIAGPIDSGLGAKASARKVTKFEITDFPEALKHARKIDAAAIRAAVEDVIARQIRAKIRVFPGVRIFDDTTTQFR